MFAISVFIMGTACVVHYGTSPAAQSDTRETILAGADLSAVDARLLLLLEDNQDWDREFLLETARDLVRNARTWSPDARDDLLSFLLVFLDVQERLPGSDSLSVPHLASSAVELSVDGHQPVVEVEEEISDETRQGLAMLDAMKIDADNPVWLSSPASARSAAGPPQDSAVAGEGSAPSVEQPAATTTPPTPPAVAPGNVPPDASPAQTALSAGASRPRNNVGTVSRGESPQGDSSSRDAAPSASRGDGDGKGHKKLTVSQVLESARQALAQDKFPEALVMLEALGAQRSSAQVIGLWREAMDGYVYQQRELAGQMFMKARNTEDPDARRELLQDVRDLLDYLLKRFPDSTYAGALKRNRVLVDRELER